MEPPKAPRLWGLCPAAMDGFNFQHRPLPLSIEVVGPRACLGLTSATIQQGQQGVTWQKAGSVQPSLRPGGAPPQVWEGDTAHWILMGPLGCLLTCPCSECS